MPMTLTQKASCVVGVFLVLVVVAVSVGFINQQAIQATTDNLTTRMVQETQWNSQFHVRLVDAAGAAVLFVHLHQAADRVRSEQALTEARAALSRLNLLDNAGQDPALPLAAERASVRQRQGALLDHVQQIVGTTFGRIDAGDTAGGEQALKDLNGLQDEARQLTTATDSLLQADVAAAADSINLRLQQASIGLGFVLALGLLLAPMGLLLMHRKIIQPMQNLARAADTVGGGRFGTISPVTSTDEMGNLQRAFNQMVHDLRALRAALHQRNSTLQRTRVELDHARVALHERGEQYRAYVETTVLSGWYCQVNAPVAHQTVPLQPLSAYPSVEALSATPWALQQHIDLHEHLGESLRNGPRPPLETMQKQMAESSEDSRPWLESMQKVLAEAGNDNTSWLETMQKVLAASNAAK